MSEPTPDFPNDSTASTNKVVRQIDCQYTFGKEHMSVILKFMGIASEVALWTSKFREGYRVLLSEIHEFSESVPTTGLQTEGKVVQSTFVTSTGSAKATIAINFPYASKVTWRLTKPATTTVTTWFEKSTDYEFGLEVYAGDESGAANAGDFEAWKNEKNKNIQNYKDFKYTVEGQSEPVELKDRTLELAKKWYAGIESVRRAYPEVIRKTQYFNIDDSSNKVDGSLIAKIKETPKLYYIDNTPDKIWTSKFKGFSWVKASYDVETEATEYSDIWNATVTESWLGIDPTDRGAWDNDLYGDNRWPFAGAKSTPQGNYDDDAPIEPEDVNGSGRVKPDTFQNQSDIKTIDLGTDFYAVDNNAFRAASTRGLRLLAATATPGAPALESIKMPSVSFIGDDAFNGAANLQSIALPNRISFLGERVFKDCSAMTEAIVEPSIYELPASTFEGCSALNGSQGGAFTVGGIVNSLGEYAFKDCTALTAINCTNALTSIGANAFENDDALTSFTMGLNSTGSITIGNEAFKGCSALADIELPVPTITVGTDSFLNAFASEVTVQAPKSFLSNLPGTSSYNYIYPAFIDTMASAEWQNDTRLLSAVVCDAITSIPENAFRGCTNCTSVTLPDTVTSLGHDAFRQSGITSFTVPPLLTGTLVYNMFYQCTALESVDFNNVTILGADIFAGCTSLTQLFNEDKLTSIQARAFSDCAFVEFNGGSGLAGLGQSCFRRNAALKSFKIPENETRSLNIGATAFDSCTALERIEIPVGGTMTIGTTIFNNGLASEIWLKAPFNADLIASIPSSKRINFIYPSFTTGIADGEWQNNAKLKSVAFSDAITASGNNSFNGCTSLEKVTIGAGITTVGNYVFQGCSSLTDVTLGENQTQLGIRMFFNCTSLRTLTIPATVTNIRNEAFRGCTSLEALTIPPTVATFGASIFQGVTNAGLELTFAGRTIAEVQALDNYPWGLATAGQTIHCTDGDITI